MAPLSLFLLCCAGVLVSSAPETKKMYYDTELAEHYFEEFIQTYKRVYANEIERNKKFQVFKEHIEAINRKNQDQNETAEFRINHFADMTAEEFKQMNGCVNIGNVEPCRLQPLRRNEPVPDEFDWRKKNKVTQVKNQKQCGSCWSFSATGSLEGQYAIVHNQLIDFSPQQLVDCDDNNNGCSGGLMSNALLYFKENGAMLESDYPYVEREQTCRYDSTKAVAKVVDCYNHNVASEEELRQNLVQYGPIAVAIDATSLQQYHGGIMNSCIQKGVNHAVLLVGYGTENGIPYWTFKNSWGTHFGENGYFRVQRNINACNMMSDYKVSPKVQ